MKTNFKRLFALVLTLCMLATLMVPVAFAEDEAVESPAVSADVAETYQIRLKDLDITDADESVEGTYDYLMTKVDNDNGGRKWNTAADAGRFSTAYSSHMLNWDVYDHTTTFNYRSDRMWQIRSQNVSTEGVTNFAALKIRVTNPGAYSLNLHTDKITTEVEDTEWSNAAVEWAGKVNAYVIPLSVVEEAVAAAVATDVMTARQVAIASLMTDEYFVGTASMAANEDTITFDTVRMDEYEYVVVYSGTSNFCLEKMTLTGEAFEKNTVATYDLYNFDLSLPYDDWAAHEYNSLLVTSTVTENEDGTIKGVAKTVTKTKANTYSKSGWAYYEIGNTKHYYRINTMYQFQVNTKNALAAFKLNVPESGDMYLSMTMDKSAVPEHLANYVDSEGSHITNPTEWTGTVKAYLVPLDVMTAATEAAGAAADAATNLTADDTYYIGTRRLLADETTVTFDKTSMEAGEYVLIYSANPGLYATSEIKLESLTVDVPKDSGYTVTQSMTLGLYNIDDPVFDQIVNGSTTFASELTGTDGEATTLRAYTDALYAAGELDWKIENYPSTFTDANFLFDTKNDRGLEVNTPADEATDTDWFALRFRVNQGDYYSLSMKIGASSANVSVYMFPAASDAMTAEELAAEMIPANGLHYQYQTSTNDQKLSVGYLDGEYILVFKAPHTSKSRIVDLNDLVLETETFTADDVQVYDFNVYAEDAYLHDVVYSVYKKVTETVTGEDGTETTVTSYVKNENPTSLGLNGSSSKLIPTAYDEAGNPTAFENLYKYIYKADGSCYPSNMNWRPDAAFTSVSTSDTTATSMSFYTLYNMSLADTGVNPASKIGVQNTKATYAYGSYMLRVNKAGTYKLYAKGSYYGITSDVYFVDEFSTNYSSATTHAKVKTYAEDSANLVQSSVSIKAKSSAEYTEIGEVTVDAAGDFLVIFGNTAGAHIQLDGLKLEPVIGDAAVAGVGGETYATFEEAIAAATEGDTISLLDNVVTDTVVVPCGVTLNLKGYSVYADTIDASASGAKIVDPSDGNAVLVADEIQFNENNPQLPLLDKTTGAYHLYNVEVESVTTTGSASATKYWFKVNFSNEDALGLIGLSTELRIMADMTGVYKEDGDGYVAGDAFAAEAYADGAFSCAWAAKNTSYIIVSTVGSGLSSFQLSPAVTANGVVISGSAMTKG